MLEVDRAFTEGERASLSDYGLASVRRRCFLVEGTSGQGGGAGKQPTEQCDGAGGGHRLGSLCSRHLVLSS